MTTSQKVEQNWETPPPDEIIKISRMHVQGLESTNDPAAWVQGGMHYVVLRTVGRKSGAEHKVALPFWRDPDGVPIVIGSFAGASQDPAWVLNMRDRAANPEVLCRVQTGLYWSVPEILDSGPEYARLWELLVADRAWYADYQAKCERPIPLVRLPETRPA
jgi:deazaflavin-dependent oxidoreductase (nitroreductase family)